MNYARRTTAVQRKKTLLTLLLTGLAVLLLAACAGGAAVPADDAAATDVPAEESMAAAPTADDSPEAPMLAELVAAGELPPLEERIPANPKVVQVTEELGQYGGNWRRAYSGISDRWGATKLLEERIIEFEVNPEDGTISIEPNWAEEFTISEDAREFTFHIREGLKWSDGVPVTTEDVRFWYEDIFQGTLFRETPHQNLTTNGTPLEIEIADDYTFTVKFADPYPLFPQILAKESTGSPGLARDSFLLPAHYLKDFHPNYVDEDELNALAEEYGVEGWINLWDSSGPIQSWWLNPDLPVISAWKIETPAPNAQTVMVRNPYYHAVDPEGRQLPYIDYITHDLFEDAETLNLWVIQGLIDLQARHIDGASNFTLFKENEAGGDYRLVTWRGASTGALYPNLNTPDPVLAELFNDSRFRQALSIGINRAEINEIVYNGLGEPRQASPVSGSPQFDAEFETKWAEYDPDGANALLDEIGLTERDGDGIRLRPDGETLQLVVTTFNDDTRELELIESYWADLGIDMVLNMVERSLFTELSANGEVDIASWSFDRGAIIPADPRRYTAVLTDGPWAPLYGRWFDSGGADGVEPPADHPIRDVWAAWESAQTAASLEEAEAFVQEMIDVHKENVWVIGTVGETPSIYIVSNRMRNMPEGLIDDDSLRNIGLAHPAQFFFTE